MKKTLGVFLKAILAGFCIGVGGNVFLGLIGTNKALGAVLFAVGLFTICTHGFNLFTGKACYILENKPSYLGTLVVIWVGNLIGALRRQERRLPGQPVRAGHALQRADLHRGGRL